MRTKHKQESLISRDREVVSPAIYRYTPVEIDRGEGVYLYDVDGNKYIDFAAGIATNNVGYAHPKVLEAVEKQCRKAIHIGGHVAYYEPYVELLEIIREHAPGELKNGKGLLVNSGTESVEAALKLARVATGRPCVISFLDAFHGRGMGALGVTASGSSEAYKRNLSGLFPGVYHAPFASAGGMQIGNFSISSRDSLDFSIGYIKKLLNSVIPPSDLAAIIVEPIQGEGGYIFPHDEFLGELREICNETGALLIADEIQTGIGRTGKMYAMEHWNVEPDIIVLAKPVGGGFPLGVVLAKKKLMDKWEPGAHGSTFGGNPVACIAGKTTIEIILEENLMENARKVGTKLVDILTEEASKYSWFKEIRGKGLLIGVEVKKGRSEPTKEQVKEICSEAVKRGLIVIKCGSATFRVIPPLNISEEVALEGVDILIDSIQSVLDK